MMRTHTNDTPGRPAARRGSRARPRAAFVAWTPIPGRQTEIARALGGEAAIFYRLGSAPKWAVPVRYAVSLAETALYLVRRRPRAVIATNPPIFPGWLAHLYGRLAGAPVLLDSHPGGFGLQGDRLSARLQGLHRRLVPRVAATLVTEPDLAARVEGWGGRAAILHEAPPAWERPGGLPHRPTGRFTVLFVCVFQRDEPVADVLAAARALPDVRFRITGDERLRDPALAAAAPDNVEWTGFLGPEEYRLALGDADVVMVLTTEPASVVRGGYEAVWAERPLIVSDWPVLRDVFPDAVHVDNHAEAIARGVVAAQERRPALQAAAPAARERQRARWREQLGAIETLIGGPA